MKNNAFTLAEVLITLGIIGVVAAMTLPAIIQKQQKIEAVTRLKRAYSLLNQALQRTVADRGDVRDWPETIPSDILIKDYLAPSLKVLKIYPPAENWNKAMCYDGRSVTTSSGVRTQYVWLDNVYISSPFKTNKTSSMKIADEICIGVNDFSYGERSDIFVDINGNAKGPNKAGHDLFFFVFSGNTIKPLGWDWSDADIDSASKQNACNLKALYGGWVCAARIMRDGWEIKY